MAKDTTVTIFTVAPFVVLREHGNLGAVKLGPAKEDVGYDFYKVPNVWTSRDIGNDDNVRVAVFAEDYAKDLQGRAIKGLVHIAKGELPTEEEINAAHDDLKEFFRKEVADCDNDWQRFRNPSFVTDNGRRGAKYLNLKRVWLDDTAAKTMCPNCSESLPFSAGRCRCGQIINWQNAYAGGLLSDKEIEFGLANGNIQVKELTLPPPADPKSKMKSAR